MKRRLPLASIVTAVMLFCAICSHIVVAQTISGTIFGNVTDPSGAVVPGVTITIRNLDEHTKARLRLRAARHKRSMEDEARNILRTALSSAEVTPGNLAEAIRRRFAPLGGVELQLPVREPMREPPKPGR